MAYRIQNNLTFIHIPKNAGTSITAWIETNFKGDFKFDNYKHATVNDINPEWQNNMFCVVRNPWDRAYSWYHFLLKTMKKMSVRRHYKDLIQPQLEILNEGFESYILNHMNYKFYKRPNVKWYSQYKPNTHYINKNVKILRYENISEDFEWVKNQTRCNQPLPILNSNRYNRSKWRSEYTNKMAEKIKQVCKQDIEYLGYDF